MRHKFSGPKFEALKSKLMLEPLSKEERAYVLATFGHETAYTWEPIEEYSPKSPAGADRLAARKSYFIKKYGHRLDLGNRPDTEDGYTYRGRGYVQLTGRANYVFAGTKLGIDLVNNPDLACDPDIAYKIAVMGMIEGWFTGRKLSHYFKPGKPAQLREARRIINRLDKADKIADEALQCLECIAT